MGWSSYDTVSFTLSPEDLALIESHGCLHPEGTPPVESPVPDAFTMPWRGTVIVEPGQAPERTEEGSFILAGDLSGDTQYLIFDEFGELPKKHFYEVLFPEEMATNSRTGLDQGTPAMGVGDFDNDGLTDYIAGGRDGATGAAVIELHRKVGAGSNIFAPALGDPIPTVVIDEPGFAAQDMGDFAVADYDGDGNLDFVVGQRNQPRVFLYTGNGDGTFQAPSTIVTTEYPRGIDAEDLDGDGDADFAVAASDSPWRLEVFLGDGVGGFSATLVELDHVSAGHAASPGLTLGDFDGDGMADAVLSNYADSDVSSSGLAFYKGNGNGTFVTTPLYSGVEVGENTAGLERSLDNDYIDDDGTMDLILADEAGQALFVFAGNGDGTFSLIPQGFAATTYSCGGSLCIIPIESIYCRDTIEMGNPYFDRTPMGVAARPYSALTPPS